MTFINPDDATFSCFQATSTMVTKMEADTQLYRSRFLMLFLFVMYSMSNAFQWIEYAIITNIVSEYYNVQEFAINWTSMIYMASYIPLIFPANWLLEKKGLRFAVLLGSFGTCLGKCSSSSLSSVCVMLFLFDSFLYF